MGWNKGAGTSDDFWGAEVLGAGIDRPARKAPRASPIDIRNVIVRTALCEERTPFGVPVLCDRREGKKQLDDVCQESNLTYVPEV